MLRNVNPSDIVEYLLRDCLFQYPADSASRTTFLNQHTSHVLTPGTMAIFVGSTLMLGYITGGGGILTTVTVGQPTNNWGPAHNAAVNREPGGNRRATIVHMAGAVDDLLPGMETPSRDGNLPLHIATRFDNLPVFQFLQSRALPMFVFQARNPRECTM